MRVKGGVKTRKRHKKLLKQVKGYRQSRSKIYRRAKEAYMHAGQYSFNHRKKRQGDMRSLWILRISATLKDSNMSYSKFMGLLNKSDINLNRKSISELAINYPKVFESLVEKVTTK